MITYKYAKRYSMDDFDTCLLEGSNELDSCSSKDWSRLVMLSAAKHLVADCDRPFASLRVTQFDCSKGLLHLKPYCESRDDLCR